GIRIAPFLFTDSEPCRGWWKLLLSRQRKRVRNHARQNALRSGRSFFNRTWWPRHQRKVLCFIHGFRRDFATLPPGLPCVSPQVRFRNFVLPIREGVRGVIILFCRLRRVTKPIRICQSALSQPQRLANFTRGIGSVERCM